MKLLLPTRVTGQESGIAPLRSGDPLWWLRDREALVRRFVLSQVMGEPKSRQRRPGPPVPQVGPGSGGRR